jgi:predicted nucleotidyltransferase
MASMLMQKLLIHKVIKNRDKILEIAKRHGVENVRIFGSVSRGQEKKHSDIDFLVDITKKPDGNKVNHITFAL